MQEQQAEPFIREGEGERDSPTRAYCPDTEDNATSLPHMYDVGGLQSSESIRSQGNTSIGSAYFRLAFPSR